MTTAEHTTAEQLEWQHCQQRGACPRCGIEAIHRSGRRLRDLIPGWLGYQPVRCHNCYRRFYCGAPTGKGFQPSYVHFSRKTLVLPPVLAMVAIAALFVLYLVKIIRPHLVPPPVRVEMVREHKEIPVRH